MHLAAGCLRCRSLAHAQASLGAAKACSCALAASRVLSSAPAASSGSVPSAREKGVSTRLRAKEKVVPGVPGALGRVMPQPCTIWLLRGRKRGRGGVEVRRGPWLAGDIITTERRWAGLLAAVHARTEYVHTMAGTCAAPPSTRPRHSQEAEAGGIARHGLAHSSQALRAHRCHGGTAVGAGAHAGALQGGPEGVHALAARGAGGRGGRGGGDGGRGAADEAALLHGGGAAEGGAGRGRRRQSEAGWLGSGPTINTSPASAQNTRHAALPPHSQCREGGAVAAGGELAQHIGQAAGAQARQGGAAVSGGAGFAGGGGGVEAVHTLL